MKLIEFIEQKIFLRDNNGTGYNVTLEGDIAISAVNSNDTIHVFHDGNRIDCIDLPAVIEETGVYCNAYVKQEAAIIIMKSHN